MGRIRLHVALDFTEYSLETFILDNIEPGSTIVTDDWQSYNIIDKEQYHHEITNQSKSKDYDKLYDAHLVTTLIKRLIRGTYQGRFEPKYLQNYLDEHVFRFNRHKSRNNSKKFMRIVQQVVQSSRITWGPSSGIWTRYLNASRQLELRREAYFLIHLDCIILSPFYYTILRNLFFCTRPSSLIISSLGVGEIDPPINVPDPAPLTLHNITLLIP